MLCYITHARTHARLRHRRHRRRHHHIRTVLLSVSMVCVIVSLGLIGAVYNYRRLKVFKVASPHFLCFTLLGCAIMYSEVRTWVCFLISPSRFPPSQVNYIKCIVITRIQL